MKIPQIEVSVKFKGAVKSELRKINNSENTAEVMRLLFDSNTIEWVEEFVMLCLNNSNKRNISAQSPIRKFNPIRSRQPIYRESKKRIEFD